MVTQQDATQNEVSVRVQPDTEKVIRSLVPFGLSDLDIMWIADWLLLVGVSTMKAAMEKYPGLALADMIQMGVFRNEYHH